MYTYLGRDEGPAGFVLLRPAAMVVRIYTHAPWTLIREFALAHWTCSSHNLGK